MKKLSFLLVCIASQKFGFGHLNRSISFSRFINKRHISKIITFSNNLNTKKIRKYNPYLIEKFSKKINIKEINKYDFVIFDISNNLFLKKGIINHLEKISNTFQEKIIILDGLKDEMIHKNKKIKKKLLICPYFVENDEIKKDSRYTKYLIGPSYFIFNPKIIKFKKQKLNKRVKNILITCGGSDLEFNSYKFVKHLLELNLDMNITVIVGPFFSLKLIKLLKKISSKFSKVNLIFNPKNIGKVMIKNDIIISSSGLTKYEIILLGLPLIMFSSNKEQKKNNRGFEKKNICVTIKDIKNKNEIKTKIKNLIQNYDKRKKLSHKLKKMIDSNGANRIIKIIENIRR